MRITQLGHSCLLVEVAGQRLLIDPGVFSRFEDVTDLDAVLVTHHHFDHLDVERLPALLAANPRAAVHANAETVAVLKGHEIIASQMVSGEAVGFGDALITPAGDQHAVIHEHIGRITNLGLLIGAPGEPTFFHPGDALDAAPAGDVDILGVPVNAPWAALKESIAFVRRIHPHVVVPIHDGLLNEAGRRIYLGHLRDHGLEGGVDVRDLADGRPADFEAID